MALNVKIVSVTVLMMMLMLMASHMAESAGECGRTPIGSVAASLAPCLPATGNAKINPAIALTVPKRCNIRNRPAGKKCGRYTVP
ncbi:hypothetical protein K1719_042349 [Acacia pycnantha]|nr:hypothetical protein K1719_042349 [Acacia pycnantha]